MARSLVRQLTSTVLRNRAPVPLVGRRSSVSLIAMPFIRHADVEAQMATMGTSGVVFAIVDRLASATSQVNWHLYRKARSGKPEERVEITEHPALVVLNTPNPFFTRQELIEAGQQHHELTGETWIVIGRNPRVPSMPLEMWPVRPDRMRPVPDPDNFIIGYVYTSADGEQVPLKLNEVIFMRRPNPLDSFRGISVIGAILPHIDGDRYSAEWNRNFFINGAQPGGIIEVGDKRLTDDEFDEMVMRWRSQHQGVSNAHRIAVLENGAKYVDAKLSQKDMDFTGLATMSGEKVREAFGFPKPMLGSVDDVNRANAEAGEYVFARWLLVQRLERWKGALNNDFLPLFGDLGTDLEFDYDSPVPADREADNSERDSKVAALNTLVGMGFDAVEVCRWLDLPIMSMAAGTNGSKRDLVEAIQKVYLGVGTVVTSDEARAILNSYGAELAVPGPSFSAPAPSSPPPGGAGADQSPPSSDVVQVARFLLAAARGHHDGHGGHRHGGGDADDGEPWRARNADQPDGPPAPDPPDPPDGINPKLSREYEGEDLQPLQDDWETALEQLINDYIPASQKWRDYVLSAIHTKVAAGDVLGLTEIGTPPVADIAALIENTMMDLGLKAGEHLATEAGRQGVDDVEAKPPERGRTASAAQAVAVMLARALVASAVTETLRVWRAGAPADNVVAQVAGHLDTLTDAGPRLALGGVLTQAQHDGRGRTLTAGPQAALYADEVLDKNTCSPCRKVNRKWLGNAGDAMVLDTYPRQGYVGCKGRQRCRGQVVAVWRGGTDWKKWVELPPVRTEP